MPGVSDSTSTNDRIAQTSAARDALGASEATSSMSNTWHTWTDDDDLLVIDLYLRAGPIGPDTTEVLTLVRLFGGDITPDSIVLALRNVEHLDNGGGLANASQHMRKNWERWGHRPKDARAEAARIRARIEAQQRGERPPLTDEAEARIAARMAERRRVRRSR